MLDTPKYIDPITKQDKKQLIRKLQMEKRQLQMIKDLLEIAEQNVSMLMEEVAPQEEDGIMMDYGSRSY
jgi:hypothetical protein